MTNAQCSMNRSRVLWDGCCFSPGEVPPQTNFAYAAKLDLFTTCFKTKALFARDGTLSGRDETSSSGLSALIQKYDNVRGKVFFVQTRREEGAYP